MIGLRHMSKLAGFRLAPVVLWCLLAAVFVLGIEVTYAAVWLYSFGKAWRINPPVAVMPGDPDWGGYRPGQLLRVREGVSVDAGSVPPKLVVEGAATSRPSAGGQATSVRRTEDAAGTIIRVTRCEKVDAIDTYYLRIYGVIVTGAHQGREVSLYGVTDDNVYHRPCPDQRWLEPVDAADGKDGMLVVGRDG